MSSYDELSPLERNDFIQKLTTLRHQNVVPSRGYLDVYGFTDTGDFVLAPNSYSRGYQDSFLPPDQRPSLGLNLLGIFGQLSDGTWIFIPSYNSGLTRGAERQNNLKFAILAEGERRLFRELQTQRQSQSELEIQLRQAQEKIASLQDQIAKSQQSQKK